MAGSMSKVVSRLDEHTADQIRQEQHRVKQEIERLTERQKILDHMWAVLKFCGRCSGSGTICETRTDDDSPWYEPCPSCGGRGHTRGQP